MLKKLVEEAGAEFLGESDGVVTFRDRQTGRVFTLCARSQDDRRRRIGVEKRATSLP
jgi:hypothetical protein